MNAKAESMQGPTRTVPPAGVKSAPPSAPTPDRAGTSNHHEKVLYLYDSRFGAGNQGGNHGIYT